MQSRRRVQKRSTFPTIKRTLNDEHEQVKYRGVGGVCFLKRQQGNSLQILYCCYVGPEKSADTTHYVSFFLDQLSQFCTKTNLVSFRQLTTEIPAPKAGCLLSWFSWYRTCSETCCPGLATVSSHWGHATTLITWFYPHSVETFHIGFGVFSECFL